MSTIKKKKGIEWVVDLIKISIIIFASVFLLGNFEPFYEGSDSYVYAITAINLHNGEYEIANQLLQDTGRWEFVPYQWVKTVHNTAVPITMPGFPSIAAFSYLISGIYGLFYLGPVLSIILLVTSERLATKLFDKYVGLVVLFFLATNTLFYIWGSALLTESIFSTLLVFGCYYLIKFFYQRNEKYLLFASSFFVATTFLRIIGLIFLPVEIFLLGLYFSYKKFTSGDIKISEKNSKHISQIITKNFNIVFFVSIPWVIFFLFFLSFNSYYFNDPFITYDSVPKPFEVEYERGTISSLFIFDQVRTENIKEYSKFILPYSVFALEYLEGFTQHLGENNLGIITLVAISFSLFLACWTKEKKIELFVLLSFVVITILFLSSSMVTYSDFVIGRYMIPSLPLFYMIVGYLLMIPFKTKFFNTRYFSLATNSIIKTIYLGSIILFFIVSFFISFPIKSVIQNEFYFINPENLAIRYPLDQEGLTKSSIVVNTMNSWAVDYGVISFNPLLGFNLKQNFDDSSISQDSIKMLKQLLAEGKDVYVFKKPSYKTDKPYLEYLIKNHEIILKDYSPTFCKMYLKEDVENSINSTSDKICL